MIKRLLLAAAFMAAFFMPAHGRMFPVEIPLPAVCWDNADDALNYHKNVLGEYPVGRGWIANTNGPTFATVLVNPTKPTWTFLHFHQNTATGKTLVCAIAGGDNWEVLTPDFGEPEKTEL